MEPVPSNAPAPQSGPTRHEAAQPTQLKVGWRDLLLMLMVAFAAITYSLLGNDKEYIQRGDPDLCGIYCRMAKDYGDLLVNRSFDRHYFQKSLHAAVTHAMLRPFNDTISPKLANQALECISAIALLLCVVLWHRIAQLLGLSIMASWLGFAGLCLGQTTLRVVPAAQESPDTIALLMGLLSLHAYVSGRKTRLLACFAVAGMVQVQLQLVLLPLVLVSMPSRPMGTGHPGSVSHGRSAASAIPGFVFDAAEAIGRNRNLVRTLIFFCYLPVFVACAYLLPAIRPPFHGLQNQISILMPASIVLAAGCMAIALDALGMSRVLRDARAIAFGISFPTAAIVAIMYFMQALATGYFARGEVLSQAGSLLGNLWLIYSFHYQAIEQPLKNVVAHLAYFGPLAALVVLRWRRIGDVIATRGDIRLVLVLCAMTMLMVNSESRHHIAFLPWFAALGLAGLGRSSVVPAFLVLAACLLTSRIYADYLSAAPTHDPFLFTWGPWYTRELYLANLAFAVAILAAVAAMLRQNREAGTPNRTPA
jgi:hypothetical protein